MSESAPELADHILDIFSAALDGEVFGVGVAFNEWWESISPYERDETMQKIIDLLDREF